MIDAAFVRAIADLAVSSVKAESFQIEEGKKIIVSGGQILATVPPDTGFGDLVVADFASFCAAVFELVEGADTAFLSVYKTHCAFTADPKRPDKRAHVTMRYATTAAFDTLCAWANCKYSVQAVNKLLKTSLYGTYEAHILSVFKQIEFSRSNSTVVAKATHRDTLGRSVDQAVSSRSGELPEFLTFTTPLFLNLPCGPVELEFYLDCDHSNETIGIAQCGDKLDRAVAETVTSVIERLQQTFPNLLIVAS